MSRVSIRAALSHRSLPLALIVLAVLFTLPVLRNGVASDDLIFSCKLSETGPIKARGYFAGSHRFVPAVMTLFDWLRPGHTQAPRDDGWLPWWTAPDVHISFWRPLSSATHWVDHRLWPTSPVTMRLHTALWFAAMLVFAWAAYRETMKCAWAAGLAAVILAINQENYQALAWIAARNALITACFVALTVWLHHRHARSGSIFYGIGAALSFAGGLLGGEGAVAALAYLVSYSLFLDSRSWPARARDMAVYGGILLAWRAIYHGFGFGVYGSGLYLDPGQDPARVAWNAARWIPVMIASILTSPILNRYVALAPEAQTWAWAASILALLVLGFALFPLLRRDRVARFWALGMVLATGPACATTVPDDRVTLCAAIGFAPLMAAFLAGVADGAPWAAGKRRWLRVAALFLAAAHLLQPLPGHAKRLASLLKPPPPARPLVPPVLRTGPEQDLVIVNPPEVMWLVYLPYILGADGAAIPAHMRLLTSGPGDLEVRRTDASTLTVVSACGPLIPTSPAVALPPGAPVFDRLYGGRLVSTVFRAEWLKSVPGDTVTLPGLTVTVSRVDQSGLPLEARFAFDRPLDDPRFHWVAWDSRRAMYVRYTPPAMGATDRLPGPFASPRERPASSDSGRALRNTDDSRTGGT